MEKYHLLNRSNRTGPVKPLMPAGRSQTSPDMSGTHARKTTAPGRFFAKEVMLTDLFTALWLQTGFAEQHTETIRKTAMFQSTNHSESTLQVNNITGDVTVEGYDGDRVEITAVQIIRADSGGKLETDCLTPVESRGGGSRWRINRPAPVRIGDGGRQYTFHVLNGEVYIRRTGS